VPFSGYTNAILSSALTPDGECVVSGSLDGTIRIWNARTGGAVRRPLVGHSDGVTSIEISDDGKHVVSGSRDRTIRIWDFETGEQIREVRGHDGVVRTIAIFYGGWSNYILSGSEDNTIRMWEFDSGEQVLSVSENQLSCMALSYYDDNLRLVSGSHTAGVQTRSVVVWPYFNMFVVAVHNYDGGVSSVAIVDSRRWIIFGSLGATVRIVPMDTYYRTVKVLDAKTPVHSVAASNDGNRVAAGLEDGTILIWELEIDDTQLSTLYAEPLSLRVHRAPVHSVAFSPDGHFILSASNEMTIRMCDIDVAHILAKLHKVDEVLDQRMDVLTTLTTIGEQLLVCVPCYLCHSHQTE
jgi:WD40 repeat protein